MPQMRLMHALWVGEAWAEPQHTLILSMTEVQTRLLL